MNSEILNYPPVSPNEQTPHTPPVNYSPPNCKPQAAEITLFYDLMTRTGHGCVSKFWIPLERRFFSQLNIFL